MSSLLRYANSNAAKHCSQLRSAAADPRLDLVKQLPWIGCENKCGLCSVWMLILRDMGDMEHAATDEVHAATFEIASFRIHLNLMSVDKMYDSWSRTCPLLSEPKFDCMRNLYSWREARHFLDGPERAEAQRASHYFDGPERAEAQRLLEEDGLVVPDDEPWYCVMHRLKLRWPISCFEKVDGRWTWKRSKSPEEKALDNIYRYIFSKTAKELSSDGGETFGTITRYGTDKLIDTLGNLKIMGKDDFFCDAGAGFNTPACHVSQIMKCPSVGFEKSPNRVFIGAKNFSTALDDPDNIGNLVNTQIAFVRKDLLDLASFGPTTVAYFFDSVYTDEVMEHLIACAVATPTLKCILSFKGSDFPSIHTLFERAGFVRQKTTVSATMQGSQQKKTINIYLRDQMSPSDARIEEPVNESERKSLDDEQLWGTYVYPVWNGDSRTVTKQYTDLASHAEAALPKRTRSATSELKRKSAEAFSNTDQENKRLTCGIATS